jgi:hypothetical protein
METDKIHKRVLEIQDQIQTSSPEQQSKMLNELIDMVSQIEQSLSNVKIDLDNIKINEE